MSTRMRGTRKRSPSPSREARPGGVAAFFEHSLRRQRVWVREDTFDSGPGYGAVGSWRPSNKAMMRLLREADPHNTTFAEGRGGDSDTLGLNKVWVYDTSATLHDQSGVLAFPPVQTELCLQFHDNQTGRYPTSYHNLRRVLLRRHRLKPTNCPTPEIDSCSRNTARRAQEAGFP